MDKTTHEIRMEHWKSVIQQCQSRPTGQTAKDWMIENGISDKQYYYWLRKIRKEAYELMKTDSLPAPENTGKPAFVELPSYPQDCSWSESTAFHPDAVIQIGNTTVAVSNSVSSELLDRIVEVMNHAC